MEETVLALTAQLVNTVLLFLLLELLALKVTIKILQSKLAAFLALLVILVQLQLKQLVDQESMLWVTLMHANLALKVTSVQMQTLLPRSV